MISECCPGCFLFCYTPSQCVITSCLPHTIGGTTASLDLLLLLIDHGDGVVEQTDAEVHQNDGDDDLKCRPENKSEPAF